MLAEGGAKSIFEPPSKDALATSTESELKRLLHDERKAHAATRNELVVERAAHDETAENMVELQHKLEVTLQVPASLPAPPDGRDSSRISTREAPVLTRTVAPQELANLEKFVKRQQKIDVEPRTPMQVLPPFVAIAASGLAVGG